MTTSDYTRRAAAGPEAAREWDERDRPTQDEVEPPRRALRCNPRIVLIDPDPLERRRRLRELQAALRQIPDEIA
jgi:hypothetical protein